MSHSVEAMQKLQASAWRDYRKAKPTAKQRQHEFLKKKAETHEEDGNDNLAKKFEKLIRMNMLECAKEKCKRPSNTKDNKKSCISRFRTLTVRQQ